MNAKITTNTYQLNNPIAVQIHFSLYEKKLRAKHDFARIEPFGLRRSAIIDEIRKTNKILWIRDTRDADTYSPALSNMIDLRAYLSGHLNAKMLEYRIQGIISEVIVPVARAGRDQTLMPFGFIHVQSKTINYNYDCVLELIQKSLELIEKIEM